MYNDRRCNDYGRVHYIYIIEYIECVFLLVNNLNIGQLRLFLKHGT